MNRIWSVLLLSAALCATLPGGLRAAVDPLAEEEVSLAGETVEQAEARAHAAVAASSMKIAVSSVGFDIAPGSEAETYLQGTARAGGGGYFTANNAGELAAAMGAAASGQTGIAGGAPPPVVPAAPVDTVTLSKPVPNAIVGPSIEVVGKTGPGALVVLYTIAYPLLTDAQPKLIPGTRQRATTTGDFSFRIATPRVSFGATEAQVRYELHAYLLHADQTKGPEVVFNLFSPESATAAP
ncbi:MAG TPA: hypothetical protein VGM19_09280 [Armatimonadota bacterium]|jgi:hypothetical protein